MDLLNLLGEHRLLAIVRGNDPEAALSTVVTLAESGVNLIELSLTTADALAVISKARTALGPQAHLGAGTVVTAHDAAQAQQAGASFLVTPAIGSAVAEASRLGLPVIAGAFTPTELVEALDRGATAIKLFPASVGGVGYLRALRDPFPEVPLVPVGGVDEEGAVRYLAAGAVAVGVGSPLVGDAASGGSLEQLRVRAQAFLRSVQEPSE